jgi:HNH endonuclease
MAARHDPGKWKPPNKAAAPARGATTGTADLEDQLDEQQGSGPSGKVVKGDVAARFWSKVDRRGDRDCWLWTGKDNGRYGYALVGRRLVGAHRIAYELEVGPIPPGFVVHHVCRTTRCVNPQHLRADTQSANVLRDQSPPARNAVKVACVHGHPFTPDNTRIRANGQRDCLACERHRNRARAEARRAVE